MSYVVLEGDTQNDTRHFITTYDTTHHITDYTRKLNADMSHCRLVPS